MKQVKIYSKKICPFCVAAKNLLEQKGVSFEEVMLDGKHEELQQLVQKTNFRTVPQIFIGEEFIGGYQELAALNDKGQLDQKLN